MSTFDPFDILGVPPRFDLSPQELRAAYLAKSATLHPDVVGGAEDDEAGSALNHAKRLLANPEARAEALLVRLGGPSKEMDRSLPPAFLQQMLETREEIEAAIASGSATDRAAWEQWAETRRRSHIEKVAELFRTAGVGRAESDKQADTGVLRAIRTELNMWRYVERLIEQLNESDRGDGGRP
jgi:molecular chaperone HscB